MIYKNSGGRKYPASEYSDRVINLNRLEDRNLENQCKIIEKDRRTILNTINREIKKLEYDLESKQDSLRALYNQEKLKILSNFPYKFLNNQFNYTQELEQSGLLERRTHSVTNKASSRRQTPEVGASRIKKIQSAHGRLSTLNQPQQINDDQLKRSFSHRSITALEDDFVEEIHLEAETKPPTRVIYRPKSSVIEARGSEKSTSSQHHHHHQLSNSVNNLVQLPMINNENRVSAKASDLKIMMSSSTESNVTPDIITGRIITTSSSSSSNSSSPVPRQHSFHSNDAQLYSPDEFISSPQQRSFQDNEAIEETVERLNLTAPNAMRHGLQLQGYHKASRAFGNEAADSDVQLKISKVSNEMPKSLAKKECNNNNNYSVEKKVLKKADSE